MSGSRGLGSMMRRSDGDDDHVALDERLRDALPPTAIHPLRATPERGRGRRGLLPLVGQGGEGYDIESLRRAHRLIGGSDGFAPAVFAVRWGLVFVSLALAVDEAVDGRPAALVWAAGLVLATAAWTHWPVAFGQGARTARDVVADVGFPLLAVLCTGFWTSPLVPALTAPIVVLGFGGGIRLAVPVAVVASALVTGFDWAFGTSEFSGQLGLEWSAVMVLVGLVAGYARSISAPADHEHSLALDRLERLSDANALLFSLHRVAQSLPASLDLGEVVDTTVMRLRGLFDYDALAILLFDETDAAWQILRSEGLSLPLRLGPTELPVPLKRALAESSLVEVRDLDGPDGPGLSPPARSGLYTPLRARGVLIGLLALERSEPAAFGPRDVELLDGFVEPAALAIDNARWFARLRTVGADEERTRIARDLHDRIGQSLAYLAFELDRIVARDEAGDSVSAMLAELRDNVRTVIGEVRETLYDLRTDVSDNSDLVATIERFAERFGARSRLQVHVEHRGAPRLPILQEREMWRIAQEAMVNVERHADATTVVVRWQGDGDAALLEVIDDGRGFAIGESGRIDSYGILGMRERAASIGATLEVCSDPGAGTVVRCRLRP